MCTFNNIVYNDIYIFRLQLRILVKGLELLSLGGRLVYSTCSLNPIEDEAVVHTALRLSQGSVTLVDCSTQLDGLLRTDGLSDWKVRMSDARCLHGCLIIILLCYY